MPGGYSGNKPHYSGGGPPQQELQMPAAQAVQYVEGGRAKADLFDSEAEKWARSFKEIAPTQLRRFYDHVLSLKRLVELARERDQRVSDADLFAEIRAEFKLLKAKAAYTYGRAENKEKAKYGELLKFCVNHTHGVKTLAEFEIFRKHFEAVIAFHKFHHVKR